jgi:hypothetical protein
VKIDYSVLLRLLPLIWGRCVVLSAQWHRYNQGGMGFKLRTRKYQERTWKPQMSKWNEQRKREMRTARPAGLEFRRSFRFTMCMKNSCFWLLCRSLYNENELLVISNLTWLDFPQWPSLSARRLYGIMGLAWWLDMCNLSSINSIRMICDLWNSLFLWI